MMKIFYAIAFAVFAAAEVYIIVMLKKRRQKTGTKATVISFGMMALLTLIVYLFGLHISYLVMLLALVSLFLNSYVGYYLNYYEKSRVVDRYLHAYGTFAMALLFYSVIIILTEKGGSVLFRSLFVFTLGVCLGAIHEIMEFRSDTKQHSQMQKGLRDTNFDTIFNIVGALAAAVAAAFLMA